MKASRSCARRPGHDRARQSGDVVLAAITSCTNTSNPAVIIGAGLLARNALRRGLRAAPWVKTSLSPGSRVAADYLAASGLQESLDQLGFQVTGYGCMTCGGGSGPLLPDVEAAVDRDDLVVAAVLSSNRNFEGRIHPQVRAAYIGSPPLVVAYALAGTVLLDLERDALGRDPEGAEVFLEDIWPDPAELAEIMTRVVTSDAFRRGYASFEGDAAWRSLRSGGGATFRWDPASTYMRRPPLFDPSVIGNGQLGDIAGARALLLLGDSINTDHISPASAIPHTGPVADFLKESGVAPKDFHSYVARRANHGVMIRGAFGNIRLRNEIVHGVEGGFTRHAPSGEIVSVYEASERYRREGVPLIVIAGTEYGSGSSRDWAAKGTRLIGVRAVVAESFERIHRSNLVGMGVIPLQFEPGTNRRTLGLDGSETFDIGPLGDDCAPRQRVTLTVTRRDGSRGSVPLVCRIDTARELEWVRAGGVLNYVMKQQLDAHAAQAA